MRPKSFLTVWRRVPPANVRQTMAVELGRSAKRFFRNIESLETLRGVSSKHRCQKDARAWLAGRHGGMHATCLGGAMCWERRWCRPDAAVIEKYRIFPPISRKPAWILVCALD
jgi:hypothetical protein